MNRLLPDYKKYFSLWILLLPIIFFLREPTGFPYPTQNARFSDITISHYPNLVYLKRVLCEDGVIPLWSPAIYSGIPLSGNPLAGLWYPPGWLALFFPLPLGINLVAALHLLWGGIGLYLLLAARGVSQRGSIFGALAFMSAPKIFAHYGAGHLTLLFAVMWTPWLIWTARRSERRGGKWHAYPGLVLGVIFLADPRWSIYAGSLWVLYVFAHSLSRQGKSREDVESGVRWERRNLGLKLVRNITRISLQTGLALLIASPLLMPLLETVRLSTRASLTSEELTTFSLPPVRLLGLLFPDYGGNHEWTIYPGVVVLVLILIAILRKGKKPEEKFWLAIAGAGTVAALGSYLPLYDKLVQLPGLHYLRVPSRALFLSVMAWAMISGFTLDAFFHEGVMCPKRRILLGLTAVTGLAITMAGGVSVLLREFPVSFVSGAILILAASWLLGSGLMGGSIKKGWYPLLVGLALLDWGFFNQSVLTYQPRAVVLAEQQDVAEYLAAQPGVFRIYSPSYSLPQQVAMEYGLELVDGVDPLVLRAYANYLVAASGVPAPGYSVTIPTFKTGNPSQDNVDYQPDPLLLGLLNVGYVVAEFDLVVDGLELQERFGETRVYSNLAVLPRAWVQPAALEVGKGAKPVDLITWRPNQVDLAVSGPGLVVLSEIGYPGWRVWVDGEEAQMLVIKDIMRGVLVGVGDHTVTFKYRPTSVILGVSGFFVGVCMVVGFIFISKSGGGNGSQASY